MSSKSKIKTS